MLAMLRLPKTKGNPVWLPIRCRLWLALVLTQNLMEHIIEARWGFPYICICKRKGAMPDLERRGLVA